MQLRLHRIAKIQKKIDMTDSISKSRINRCKSTQKIFLRYRILPHLTASYRILPHSTD